MMAHLNRDYLALLIADGGAPLASDVMKVLREAPPPLLDSIASCSFALFVMRMPGEVQTPGPVPQVNDPAIDRYGISLSSDGTWPAFVAATWSFAWHLCRTSPLAARVMLGLPATAIGQAAGLEPWQLRHLAGRQCAPVAPRWPSNPCFWPDLVRYADNQSPLRLTASRLLGMQLLAADVGTAPATSQRRPGSRS